jgi:hypothetical protein
MKCNGSRLISGVGLIRCQERPQVVVAVLVPDLSNVTIYLTPVPLGIHTAVSRKVAGGFVSRVLGPTANAKVDAPVVCPVSVDVIHLLIRGNVNAEPVEHQPMSFEGRAKACRCVDLEIAVGAMDAAHWSANPFASASDTPIQRACKRAVVK